MTPLPIDMIPMSIDIVPMPPPVGTDTDPMAIPVSMGTDAISIDMDSACICRAAATGLQLQGTSITAVLYLQSCSCSPVSAAL